MEKKLRKADSLPLHHVEAQEIFLANLLNEYILVSKTGSPHSHAAYILLQGNMQHKNKQT